MEPIFSAIDEIIHFAKTAFCNEEYEMKTVFKSTIEMSKGKLTHFLSFRVSMSVGGKTNKEKIKYSSTISQRFIANEWIY